MGVVYIYSKRDFISVLKISWTYVLVVDNLGFSLLPLIFRKMACYFLVLMKRYSKAALSDFPFYVCQGQNSIFRVMIIKDYL